MANNKIHMTIAGVDYCITTDDDPEYMKALGEEISQKIQRMLRENDTLSITMAATLVAMEYCDIYVKSENNADNLRKQIKEYLEESAHIRAELEVSKRELERLSRENQSLRDRLQNRRP